jgi:hypothetical protein
MKKRLLVLVMSLALLLAFLPVFPAIAEGEFTAKLATFLDDGFNGDIGSWPDLSGIGGEVTFNVGEEVTITVDYGEEVKFASNFSAIETDVPFPGHVGQILSLKLDGNVIPMGAAHVCDEGITKGSTLRLTIRNDWNPNIPVQPLELEPLDPFTVLEVTFIITEGELPPDGMPPPPPAGNTPDFDPMGEYMAFLGIQVDGSWVFRNAWADPSFGAEGSNWANFDGNHFNSLFRTGGDGLVVGGVFTDVVIAGNGTYRVSLVDYGDNLDVVNERDEYAEGTELNLLFISTNIPYMGDEVDFYDVKVTIGGRQVNHFRADRDQHPEITDGEGKGFYEIYVIHKWRMDEVFGYNMPTEGGEIALEFTVSGFGYDKAEDDPVDDTPGDNAPGDDLSDDTPADATPPADTSDDDGGGLGFWLWVIIGGVVVIIGAVVLVAAKKKK